MRETPQQLTREQVARYCGVSPQTVEDWLNNGRLLGQSKNGQRWVETAELIHFMDENHLAIPVDLIAPLPPVASANDEVVEEPAAVTAVQALVVDGDFAFSHALGLVMKDLGLSSHKVADAQAALEQLRSWRPQLLTLVLDKADPESLALITAARAEPLSFTKVLVVSNQMPSALVRAKAAGADAILTKPVDNDTLKRTIKILLNLA